VPLENNFNTSFEIEYWNNGIKNPDANYWLEKAKHEDVVASMYKKSNVLNYILISLAIVLAGLIPLIVWKIRKNKKEN
tara:strand:+ start:325 stop:558 length:234 start_codon:yes stop_codon:yes gene_type:complete